MFLLSAFSRRFSPSSFSFVALSRVTARTTSNVRPCRTRFCARVEDGSGVNSEGNLNGFAFGCKSFRKFQTEWIALTASLLPVVSNRRISLFSTALSASSRFQKHTKPVPRERPVLESIVILAYRSGPNALNLIMF